MSSPTASAVVVPNHQTNAKESRLADESSLRRIPTLDEVPVPPPVSPHGEVVVYRGISFGPSVPSARTSAYSSPSQQKQQPIERLELFTDHARPGQVFARVLILEEGQPVPREALITPLIAVSRQDQQQLDASYSLHDLVEQANVEISRFFDGFGPIDSEIKLKEFKNFVSKQDSLHFLFTNLVHRNRGLGFDLFSAYFAPGGAMSGVGVFVNTWL